MANIYRFMRFPEGKLKAVTFSYDDGVKQDVRFSQILNANGLKGTFNLNSGFMSEESDGRHMTYGEVREHLRDKGHEIAVHGANHRANGNTRPIEGIRDVLDCRLELEEKCDRIIRGMAYPDSGITRMDNFGSYEQIKQYLTELDIAYARSLGADNDSFMLPLDFHAWIPTAHHNNPSIMEYIDRFLSLDVAAENHTKRYPRLFYIWGHSYEFDNNDNWDHIEAICQRLAKCDDVWYATNIEICDYVEAYKRLIYSADGYRVYNPNVVAVWLNVDGVSYKVAPGETLKIPKN